MEKVKRFWEKVKHFVEKVKRLPCGFYSPFLGKSASLSSCPKST